MQFINVSIAPVQHTKIGPQKSLGIYIRFESSSIIKYIEPLVWDLFTTRFDDGHFDEPLAGV